jgi:hypothetical protein
VTAHEDLQAADLLGALLFGCVAAALALAIGGAL